MIPGALRSKVLRRRTAPDKTQASPNAREPGWGLPGMKYAQVELERLFVHDRLSATWSRET